MKKLTVALSICTFLFACSDEETITTSPEQAYDEVEVFKDLPKCTDKKKGTTYYVQEKNTKYKCTDGKWVNEFALDSAVTESSASDDTSKTSSSGKSSSGGSSSGKGSSSSSAPAQSSSSSVYYTVELFGKCTADREGERKRQTDSTRANYLSDFLCEPPYWRRMIAYDYSLEELRNPKVKYGTLIDERDGEEYKTVVIGNVEWMAENLRYKVPGDTMFNGGQNCYRKNPNYCKVGGYYYSYKDKNIACPAGWGLPGQGTVKALADNTTTESLKSQLGWYTNETTREKGNTNESGFTMVPEGNVIMASELYNTQEYLGYFNLPNSFPYAGGSYSGAKANDKQYHIRCIRGAKTSSSSVAESSSSVVSSSSVTPQTSSSVVSSSSATPQTSSSVVSSSSVTPQTSSSVVSSSSAKEELSSAAEAESSAEQD